MATNELSPVITGAPWYQAPTDGKPVGYQDLAEMAAAWVLCGYDGMSVNWCELQLRTDPVAACAELVAIHDRCEYALRKRAELLGKAA